MTKGCPCTYDVTGATLKPGNGILLQMMDTDDPFNPKGSYSDPTEEDQYIPGRNLTKAERSEDCFAIFTDMELEGNLFNATTDLKFEFIPLKPLPGEPGGPPLEPLPDGTLPKVSKMMGNGPMNLSVQLKNTKLTGSISSTKAVHRVPKIDKTNCEELGEVMNTPMPAINNGVIVSLDAKSIWEVSGQNYINALTLEPGALVIGTNNTKVEMTVDGEIKTLEPGHFVGNIVLRQLA